MSRASVVPIRGEAENLNIAQQTGLDGIHEQLANTYALITATVKYLKSLDMAKVEDQGGLETAYRLLDMAEDECGDRECWYRVKEGRYRS